MVGMQSPRQNPDAIRRLLELRRAESLTFKQLSERSGIPVHVLMYRSNQDRRAQASSSLEAGGFVELVGVSESRSATSGLEVIMPSGLRVALAVDFDAATLSRVLSHPGC